MEICKICLAKHTLESEDTESPNQNEIQMVQHLIPELDKLIIADSLICWICVGIIKNINKFTNDIKNAEQKIESAIPNNENRKLDLSSLHSQVNALPTKLKQHVAVCRLCFKFIATPSIFLYENKYNILGHEIIQNMLLFCNINLNLNMTKHPTICNDCWQNLQILFSFKKNSLEVNRKISYYCNKFNLQCENIDNIMLRRIYKYFSAPKYKYSFPSELPSLPIQQSVKTENTTHIVTEHDYYYKDQAPQNFAVKQIERKKKKTKYVFTESDDRMLITTYLVITKNELDFPKRYLSRIFEIWSELNPKSRIPKYAIVNRIKYLRSNTKSRHFFELKAEVSRNCYIDSKTNRTIMPLKNNQNDITSKNKNHLKIDDQVFNKVRKSSRVSKPVIPFMVINKPSKKRTSENRNEAEFRECSQSTVTINSFPLKQEVLPISNRKQNFPKTLKVNVSKLSPYESKDRLSLCKQNGIDCDIQNVSQTNVRIPEHQPMSTKTQQQTISNVSKEIRKFEKETKVKRNRGRPNILKSTKNPANFTNKCEIPDEKEHSSRVNCPIEIGYFTPRCLDKTDYDTHFINNCNRNVPDIIERNVKPDIFKLSNYPGENKKEAEKNMREPTTSSTFEENKSDSDDPIVDEVAPDILAQSIKVEPLDDSDVEICVDEPKQTIYSFDSDSEQSLPELERMDIPPMNIKIASIFTLDNKADMLNEIYTPEDPNINVEKVNTCRRFVFKNQPVDSGDFKCLECNFETKYRNAALVHSSWHDKMKSRKRLHECSECPYKISNKWLLKKHMKLHREENEIPELLPWT